MTEKRQVWVSHYWLLIVTLGFVWHAVEDIWELSLVELMRSLYEFLYWFCAMNVFHNAPHTAADKNKLFFDDHMSRDGACPWFQFLVLHNDRLAGWERLSNKSADWIRFQQSLKIGCYLLCRGVAGNQCHQTGINWELPPLSCITAMWHDFCRHWNALENCNQAVVSEVVAVGRSEVPENAYEPPDVHQCRKSVVIWCNKYLVRLSPPVDIPFWVSTHWTGIGGRWLHKIKWTHCLWRRPIHEGESGEVSSNRRSWGFIGILHQIMGVLSLSWYLKSFDVLSQCGDMGF